MNFQFSIFKLILLIIILSIFVSLPNFTLAQSIEPPESPSKAKEMGIKIGKEIQLNFWGVLKKIWREKALPLWQKMYQWLKGNIWEPYIGSFLKNLKKEFEKRKPTIEEEFKKEKKEMKEEIKIELPGIFKSLWQKLKELIK